jgi:protein gp37
MFPRAKNREKGAFKTTLPNAMKNVDDSMRRFASDSGKRLSDVVISSNVSLGVSRPADTGGGGFDHCYAEVSTPVRIMRAGGRETWGPGAPRHRTSAANWKQPLRWNEQPFVECMGCGWRGESRAAALVENPPGFFPSTRSARVCPNGCGPLLKEARRRVFCASLADVFDNEVDPAWRADLFALIAQTPNLDWLLLTKRIGNAARMIVSAMLDLAETDRQVSMPYRPWPWPNVWLGATVVTQGEADSDVVKLLMTPAAVRFVSLEPLLASVDLTEMQPPGRDAVWVDAMRGSAAEFGGSGQSRTLPQLDWVITGGESGPHARPANPQWFRDVRDRCAAAGVSYLHKQNGAFASVSEVAGAGAHHTFQDGRTVRRVGKALAGRTLDGQVHNGFPEVRHG